MDTKLPKLTLNQETIQNLTPSEKMKAFSAPVIFCKTIPSPTCPECPSPAV